MKLERKPSWACTRYIRDKTLNTLESNGYGTPLWNHTRQNTIIYSVGIVADIEHSMYLALWNLPVES